MPVETIAAAAIVWLAGHFIAKKMPLVPPGAALLVLMAGVSYILSLAVEISIEGKYIVLKKLRKTQKFPLDMVVVTFTLRSPNVPRSSNTGVGVKFKDAPAKSFNGLVAQVIGEDDELVAALRGAGAECRFVKKWP